MKNQSIKTTSMKDRLLDALLRHQHCTSTQLTKYDINNVSQRVADLRKEGWIIQTLHPSKNNDTTYVLIGLVDTGV